MANIRLTTKQSEDFDRLDRIRKALRVCFGFRNDACSFKHASTPKPGHIYDVYLLHPTSDKLHLGCGLAIETDGVHIYDRVSEHTIVRVDKPNLPLQFVELVVNDDMLKEAAEYADLDSIELDDYDKLRRILFSAECDELKEQLRLIEEAKQSYDR